MKDQLEGRIQTIIKNKMKGGCFFKYDRKRPYSDLNGRIIDLNNATRKLLTLKVISNIKDIRLSFSFKNEPIQKITYKA